MPREYNPAFPLSYYFFFLAIVVDASIVAGQPVTNIDVSMRCCSPSLGHGVLGYWSSRVAFDR